MIYTLTNAHHGHFDRAFFKHISEAPSAPGNIYWYDQHDASTRNTPFNSFVQESHFREIASDPTSKILIFYGDEYYNLKDLEDWAATCKKWGIAAHQLYVFCVDENWREWTLKTLKELDFEGINIQEYNLLMKRVAFQKQKPMTKRFSALSRNYNAWRLSFYARLLQKGVLENTNYTFNNINPYQNIVYPPETLLEDLSVFEIEADEQLVNWINGMPYATQHDVQEKLAQEVYALISASGINIVIESHFDPYWTSSMCRDIDPRVFSPAFPTEKTYKAVACVKPFIMFSTPYFLKEFRDLGYKTFSPFINESYDDILEDKMRLLAIVDEAVRLNSLSDDDFAAVVEGCREIAEHNLQIMRQRKDEFKLTDEFKWVEPYLAKAPEVITPL